MPNSTIDFRYLERLLVETLEVPPMNAFPFSSRNPHEYYPDRAHHGLPTSGSVRRTILTTTFKTVSCSKSPSGLTTKAWIWSLMDFQSEGSIVECSTGYYLAGLIPVPARSQRLRLSPPLYCVRVSVPASRDCGESNIPAGAIFLHG